MYDEQHRLASQFKAKPNLSTLIKSLIDDDIESTNDDLLNKRGLNTAVGKQLDGIGEIVGLTRPHEPLDDTSNFGFAADDLALGYGTLDDVSIGGYFTQLNPPLVIPINDDTYRLAIKGQIFKNHTNMTVDETLEILSIIFQTEVRYFLPSNLNPTYTINKILRPYEEELLKKFPQTIGIVVSFRSNVRDNAFGFSKDDDALGYGTTEDESIGGHYATII
ncbi:MAG: DUF2612 domain-containing protein [Campylobacterota bacterium]|nr:DUF2612 domain-containing protein [Campylobacterota bacterium]